MKNGQPDSSISECEPVNAAQLCEGLPAQVTRESELRPHYETSFMKKLWEEVKPESSSAPMNSGQVWLSSIPTRDPFPPHSRRATSPGFGNSFRMCGGG